jgi:prepilin signal peptidase PulO-like enzyme (type II secretory pathway)
MGSWRKSLAIALGIPSTILGLFFGLQELVRAQLITQNIAQTILILVVVMMLIKMIQVSWKKKK